MITEPCQVHSSVAMITRMCRGPSDDTVIYNNVQSDEKMLRI